MSKNKEPLVIYWAPCFDQDQSSDFMDWNMMYSDPVNLSKELLKSKSKESKQKSLFNCPAVGDRLKTSFVFRNNLKTSFYYDVTDEDNPVVGSTEGVFVKHVRTSGFRGGAGLELALRWVFFSEEPVTAMVNMPMFHKPSDLYTKGFLPSGRFDISKWFRPIVAELQMYENKGNVTIEEGDVLFYLELITDRPVILKRFQLTQRLYKYAFSCSKAADVYGERLPLSDRYHRFLTTSTDKLVLKEIKDNLV